MQGDGVGGLQHQGAAGTQPARQVAEHDRRRGVEMLDHLRHDDRVVAAVAIGRRGVARPVQVQLDVALRRTRGEQRRRKSHRVHGGSGHAVAKERGLEHGAHVEDAGGVVASEQPQHQPEQ